MSKKLKTETACQFNEKFYVCSQTKCKTQTKAEINQF